MTLPLLPQWRGRGALWSDWGVDVRIVLADTIASGLGVGIASLPMLTDQQLWEGYKAVCQSGSVPHNRELLKRLTMGECFGITVGKFLDSPHLPVGGCITETLYSAGLDRMNFRDCAMANAAFIFADLMINPPGERLRDRHEPQAWNLLHLFEGVLPQPAGNSAALPVQSIAQPLSS